VTVFSCEQNWEAVLSCIYAAFNSKLGYKNISLRFEPIDQLSIFDEYIHVDCNKEHAEKMMDLINLRISPYVYNELAFCSMSHEEDMLDNIYRVLILGFNYGPNILGMVQYRDVMRNMEIRKALGREIHHFVEFSRFHKLPQNMYVAHIEPRSRLVQGLGHHFSDRMPSEHWMIIDDIHKEAIVHPKDEEWYYRKLSNEEFNRLLKTEEINDEYTDMWKVFFNAIAIKERNNPRCQTNFFPKWTRKHAVEFL